MAAPASPLKQLPRWAPEDLGRYQFQVVTANVTDAVMAIGGLIFDRAMAGWDVSVVVQGDIDRCIDDRPIRILGGKVGHLAGRPNRAETLPRPHILAVATDVLVRSQAVRRQVAAAGDDNGTEVLLWGRFQPPNLNCRIVAVRHRPSAAAHVFKSHALAAGGATAVQPADEGFYSVT
ncbi:MAG: hypothetical protein WA488_27015 [Mycobacterium sp.]|uniref:hypothetical protein n=1 Tax=Mycobacterium sp. TaxID=1785 RepID=UPI003BB69BA8